MNLFQTNIVKLNFIRENIQNPTYYFLAISPERDFKISISIGLIITLICWKVEALIKSVMVIEFSFS